jgi:hypothetical protein
MRKQILISAAASIVLLILSTAVYAQSAARVKFGKNATSAIVSGNLNGYKDQKVFVIKVRAGQTLDTAQIKAETSTHYISVSIKSPSGEDVTDSDASCNSAKTAAPTEAGDYTITVYECQKADAWSGQFKLKVSVKRTVG